MGKNNKEKIHKAFFILINFNTKKKCIYPFRKIFKCSIIDQVDYIIDVIDILFVFVTQNL